ncbi:26S proteasome regulatory subunit RPN6 [Rhodotorula toruloides]|uniref:Putative 26S proteasome non-atpase regulatory subunit Rpn6 n=1 Tax=Rhodotorula toruloides TaxID=5286 RepID=A0A2T0A3A7_RHOTO|nr:26S proteasome regulatory subunit RPN6 [Rhodotorula toruloides]PRQ72498.1 putative 26S proteasome non-atpase regulatory subunit Rpn6 [Rhodotorula toruloides]
MAHAAGPRDDELLRDKEQAILKLGELYRDEKNADALAEVLKSSRPLVEHMAKAKTAKLIRNLLDFFADIPGSTQVQIDAVKESAEWAKSEKRIFLKQNLETRLVALYIDNQNYKDALSLINSLLRELKKLDDKMILTEVHLLESRVNHALANMPKAKAALTSARTAANAIYCPPLLQASLDMQSGVLHAEDKDYKTAYSYFFEAFEGYSGQDDPKAVPALKYMLLCKIMLNLAEDVKSIVAGKSAQRYAGPDVEAMKAVAKAHEERSLQDFERELKDRKKELSDDPIIRNHLAALYDTLLEQNLVRIIEPYSRVEIKHVAEMVKQPVRDVEIKLSQMILDKVFHGILDQGAGCLIVFDEPEVDATYEATLETIGHVRDVVDQLFQRTRTAVI